MRAWFADMDLVIDSCNNPALYTAVCNWTDVPYKYASCTKKGVDCSGLSKALYKQVYDLELQGGSRHIFKACEQVEQAQLEEGDLVFFKIYNDNISHVGVYLGNHKFVHASTKRGVIVSDLREQYYRTRFYRGGRIVIKEPVVEKAAAPVETPALPADTLSTGYEPASAE